MQSVCIGVLMKSRPWSVVTRHQNMISQQVPHWSSRCEASTWSTNPHYSTPIQQTLINIFCKIVHDLLLELTKLAVLPSDQPFLPHTPREISAKLCSTAQLHSNMLNGNIPEVLQLMSCWFSLKFEQECHARCLAIVPLYCMCLEPCTLHAQSHIIKLDFTIRLALI